MNYDAIDDIKRKACKQAEDTQCCLNCRFSYFIPYGEQGMCHNEQLVQGSLYPKIVGEFYACPLWQKK
jgi:hypothetical protein